MIVFLSFLLSMFLLERKTDGVTQDLFQVLVPFLSILFLFLWKENPDAGRRIKFAPEKGRTFGTF